MKPQAAALISVCPTQAAATFKKLS